MRRGRAPAVAEPSASAALGLMASSQGRAMAVPSPRKTVRREIACAFAIKKLLRAAAVGHPRRFKNGSLSTIPCTSAENR